MKNKTLLYINRALSFIVFLVVFGSIIFDYGVMQGTRQTHEYYGNRSIARTNDAAAFLLVGIYFVQLIFSHLFIGAVFYSKKPYIAAAIVPTAFIVFVWMVIGVGCLLGDLALGTTRDIILMCIITARTLAIGIIYFLAALKFEKNQI